MYKSYLLNIPHSGVLNASVFADKTKAFDNHIKYSDLFSDELFYVENADNIKSLIFEYSRFNCDVERYWDDNMEIMSKVGQGVFYVKYNDGSTIIRNDDKDSIKIIYDKYHNELKKITSELNDKFNNCLIVDCHTFNDDIIENSPDICIGVNNNDFDPPIMYVKDVISQFENNGYVVSVNKPYSGAIYPWVNHKKNINSMMIEVNKRCYLSDNNKIDNVKLNKFNNILNEIIK